MSKTAMILRHGKFHSRAGGVTKTYMPGEKVMLTGAQLENFGDQFVTPSQAAMEEAAAAPPVAEPEDEKKPAEDDAPKAGEQKPAPAPTPPKK